MEQFIALERDALVIRVDDNTELRSVQPEDAEELSAVVNRNRDRLYQWLAWAVPGYSLEDARRFLARHSAEYAEGESLAMNVRHRGALCGAIALHRFDPLHKNTSIGYWIDEAHEGKGIVTAACRAMISEGFRARGLHRIEIRCATWNHRSSAVPRRLGFVEEGILRDAEYMHGQWVDLRVFSMLAQDWA